MDENTTRQKTIAATYAEIQRCDQNGDFERALKAANRILHMEPQEQPAFHCKIVCLIQLSKFEEALQAINKFDYLSGNLLFEKAYCLYRLNRHDEALTIINQNIDLDYRVKELKAQILYRIEDYEESINLYRDIIKNTNDEYENEHQTNLSAAFAFVKPKLIRNELENLPEDSYELCFNKACMLIADEQYDLAERKLRTAEKLCRESLEEEEATDEEIDVDLALIRIQLAFVYQKLGKVKDAHQLYISTLKVKIADPALIAVASNNVVCINKDQNIFDSKKKMRLATNEQLIYKLPSSVKKHIAVNSAIFAYYTNQSEQLSRLCKTIEETYPGVVIKAQILTALNLVKSNKSIDAINLLKNKEIKDRNDNLYLKLCCAHLYLMQGETEEACKALESLGDDKYRPGIVGALITLYISLNKEELALKVFEKTVDYYRANQIKKGDLSEMWRQAADFHIRNGYPRVAVNSLEEILRTSPGDKKTIAQLVLACTLFDTARASELSQKLPSVAELSKGIDLEALETSGLSAIKKTPARSESQTGTPKSESTSIEKRKKHKKRKGKLPKNYDPKVAPDPERWLPRYERTGYRRKRDRRIKEIIKGSQGMSSTQTDQYDFSTKMEEIRSSEAVSPASSNVEPSPRLKSNPAHKKQQQQKKKNKRR